MKASRENPFLSFLLLFVAFGMGPASGVSRRSSSLEWKTDSAETLVIARVNSTEGLEPLDEHFDTQQVTLKLVEVIKGNCDKKKFRYREEYRKSNAMYDWSKHRLEEGDRVLLFLEGGEVSQRINLSRPIVVADHNEYEIYNNDQQLLPDEASILEVVRQRIDAGHELKRGLIVP